MAAWARQHRVTNILRDDDAATISNRDSLTATEKFGEIKQSRKEKKITKRISENEEAYEKKTARVFLSLVFCESRGPVNDLTWISAVTRLLRWDSPIAFTFRTHVPTQFVRSSWHIYIRMHTQIYAQTHSKIIPQLLLICAFGFACWWPDGSLWHKSWSNEYEFRTLWGWTDARVKNRVSESGSFEWIGEKGKREIEGEKVSGER